MHLVIINRPEDSEVVCGGNFTLNLQSIIDDFLLFLCIDLFVGKKIPLEFYSGLTFIISLFLDSLLSPSQIATIMPECIYIVGVSTCVGSGKSSRGDKRKISRALMAIKQIKKKAKFHEKKRGHNFSYN